MPNFLFDLCLYSDLTISHSKHMLWVLKHVKKNVPFISKEMFKLMDKKILIISCPQILFILTYAFTVV